jgi:site-specific recombinase XerD
MRTSRPTLGALLESFLQQRLCAQRHASAATIAAYRDALRLFVVFAAEQTGKRACELVLMDLDGDRVLAFLDHLECTRGNSVRTRNARRAALRAFYQHVAVHDPGAIALAQRILAIPAKRGVRPLLGHLTRKELDAVLAAPDRTTALGRRDHALLLFLARTGARVSECIQVEAADVRFERPTQVVLHGKGAKDRAVPLAPDLVAVLKALCSERQLGRHEARPLFTNAAGRRLTRFGVTHLLARAVTAAAVKCPELATRKVSPHTMRHTTAMHLLQAGVDVNVIRAWLGHVSLDTTHQYVEADLEMKRRALAKGGVTEASPALYEPPDELLALLERLGSYVAPNKPPPT